jgi:hypothetical protein
MYLAYGRELWSLTRQGITGPALTLAAQGCRDKWNYKGFLAAGELDKVSLIFNLVTA